MNKKITSVLEMRQYIVKKIDFKYNEKFEHSSKNKILMSPELNRKITKIDDDTVSVDLSIKIESEELPFFVDIQIGGIFVLKEWEKEENIVIIENNTVAILFPYLRTLVTTVTSNANLNPYILPIINVAEYFKSVKK